MSKKNEALDALSPEMAEKVDDLAYEFLKELGYDTEGAREKLSVRKRLKKELENKGHVLLYRAFTNEEMEMLFYYEIVRAGTENKPKPELLFRSKAVKFVFKKPDKDKSGADGD